MSNNEHSKRHARKRGVGDGGVGEGAGGVGRPCSCQVFALASCLSEGRLCAVTVGL